MWCTHVDHMTVLTFGVKKQPRSIHMRCLWSSAKHEELGRTGWVPRVPRTEVALWGFGPSEKSHVTWHPTSRLGEEPRS